MTRLRKGFFSDVVKAIIVRDGNSFLLIKEKTPVAITGVTFISGEKLGKRMSIVSL